MLLALVWMVAVIAACGPSGPSGDSCSAQLLPGDLVITEVFADHKAAADGTGDTGVDAGKEWFEIYNARGEPIDLAGLVITHSRPDGSRPNAHVMAAAAIAARQYFTLGSAPPEARPPYVDYGYGTDLGDLSNTGGGKLTLSCGDREIDSAIYGDVVAGHARALSAAQPPDYTRNDDAAQWCQADDTEFEPGNFGTPGAANDCRALPAAGLCEDDAGMRPIVRPAPGQLVIDEILANPANVAGTTDATREWFEVASTGDGFDLNELVVGRIATAGTPIQSARCLGVPAHGFAVLARSADPSLNGGLPAVQATFRFALVDTNGDIQIAAGATVLDTVRWASVTSGVAHQLDPRYRTPADNDDDAHFCAATASYGDQTNLGTPGAENRPCP
jgi:hypothetical protein